MKTLIRIWIAIVGIIGVSACMSGKPFQPNPPTYTLWIKTGANEEEVKQTMRDCGYINLTGYGGPVASDEEMAKRQICMFSKGFKRKDGYKGICSLKSDPPIAACKNFINPQSVTK